MEECRTRFAAALQKLTSQRVAMQEYGLRQFINLCLQHEYRQQFFFFPSALRAVTALLSSTNEVAVMLAFHLLSHLAMDTEKSIALATKEVLGRAMEVLRSPSNLDLVEKCLWLVNNLGHNEQALVALTDAGMTEVLIELLCVPNASIRQTAANTLQNLVSSTKCPAPSFLDNQRTFCRLRGVQTTIELLMNERTETASAALGLMNALASATGEREVTVKKIIMVAGALPVLVSLASPEGDPVLRDRAVFIMVSLSLVAGYEKKFVEAGAVVPLLEMLSDESTSDKLRTLALILLQNLSASDDVRQLLHFSGIVRALQDIVSAPHRGDAKQLIHLLLVIANLAVDETIRLEMGDAGMLAAVIRRTSSNLPEMSAEQRTEFEEAMRNAVENLSVPVNAGQRAIIMSDALARFRDLCPQQAGAVFAASSAPRLSGALSPLKQHLLATPQPRAVLRPSSPYGSMATQPIALASAPPSPSPGRHMADHQAEAGSASPGHSAGPSPSPGTGGAGTLSPPQTEKPAGRRSSFVNMKEEMPIDKIQKVSQLNSVHISRTHIAREILASEQSYVRSLEACIRHFVEPLTAPTSFLPDDVSRVLFHNIREVHRVNASFLSMLEDRMRDWSGSTILGDLFATLFRSNMADIYVPYINNFDTALALVGQLNDDVPQYRRFSDDMKLRHNLDLASLLVAPVQRMPRYILLLKSFLKRTPPMHPDCVLLNKAYAAAKELTDKINEAKRSCENAKKVAELEKRITGLDFALSSPNRSFVRQGLLIEVSTVDTSSYRFAILLTDKLLLTMQEKSKYRVIKAMPVRELIAVALPGTDEIQNIFCITWRNESFVLSASSAAERDEWVADTQKHGASPR